jgi:putative ATPase
MIEKGNIPSMILWGPPGSGKTTLARLVANIHHRTFFQLSAIESGVKDVRETIDKAQRSKFLINPIQFCSSMKFIDFPNHNRIHYSMQ